jgi:fibronectin type 3 domain-containing protein
VSLRITPLLLAVVVACSGCASVPSPASLIEAPAREAAPIREDLVGDLPAIEGLSALSGELRAIPLRWQPVLAGPVSGYLVERAAKDAAASESIIEDTLFERVAVIGDAFTPRWVDRGESGTGLADGATYHYRVRAIADDGALGAIGSAVSGKTAALPDRPRGVRAISRLPRRVALSWDPSLDPTVAGYRIVRSPSALGEFRLIAELDGRFATSYIDEGLGDLRVFYYRVAAVNAAGGTGDPSPPERAVTKPEPLPADGVEVHALELGRNQVRWRANVEPDLAGYRITRDHADGRSEQFELPQDQTEFIDEGLAAGEEVSYTVHAFDRDALISGASGPFAVSSVAYGLAGTVTPEGVVLVWDPAAQSALLETRILSLTTFGSEELGRVAEARFVDRAPPVGSRRYQLIGVRPDGSQAPPSMRLELQIKEPSAEEPGAAAPEMPANIPGPDPR